MYLGIRALLGLQVFPEIPTCLQGEMMSAPSARLKEGSGEGQVVSERESTWSSRIAGCSWCSCRSLSAVVAGRARGAGNSWGARCSRHTCMTAADPGRSRHSMKSAEINADESGGQSPVLFAS